MDPQGLRRKRLDSTGAILCLLEAERGFEMHRSTCPDGQFWLTPRGWWTVQREGIDQDPQVLTYYAPREPCRRISEAQSLSVGIQLLSPLMSQLTSQAEKPIHELPWGLKRSVLRIASLWMRGQLDPDLLENLVAEIPFEEPSQPSGGMWLRAAREAISDQLLAPLDLTHLASEFGVSPCHLSSSFRKQFGVTISQYRRRLRLEKALSLAALNELTLYEAAAEAGFYDASHFHRSGLHELGLSPRELSALYSEKSKSRTRLTSHRSRMLEA